jgi:AAA domain
LELALDALEATTPPTGGNSTKDRNEDRGRVEWEDAFGQILTGESYHPTLAPLAASMAAWGAPAPVTDNVLRCLLLNSHPQGPERAHRRDVELAKLPETIASAYRKFGGEAKGDQERQPVHWHGEDTATNVTRDWLIDGLLPRTGVGLISGQWGLYKTFVSLDLAAAIMAGLAFIDYAVPRRGGVLFVAAEGASEIPIRIEAVRKAKYPTHAGLLPFAWIDECPRLLGPKAVEKLAATAAQVGERLQRDFTLPLALILIDTVVDAAGYAKPGDENDAALGQLIMHRMAELARRAGALVIGIDHFGKQAETGTRGSSAKEGRADVVLALLGNKGISGEVSNTRLAVRKNRAGPSGRELPFAVRLVDLGTDDNGQQVTSLVIDWGQSPKAKPGQDEHWSKSLRLLRQVLMTLLASDQAGEQRPFADGPMVRAVDLELARAEFCRMYPAEGNPRQKSEARRKAFQRAVTGAQGGGLIGVCDIGATTFVWLATGAKA